MGRIFRYFLLVVCFLTYNVGTAEPNMKACIDNYELSFYCDAIQFEDARKACIIKGSYLVRIDNANMTETINNVLDRISCPKRHFHAGATADSQRRWTWLDGSKVYLSSETGYQNWQAGQPNDVGGREDCLRIDIGTKQWVDSPCGDVGSDGKPAEQRYYICQKDITLNIEIKKMSFNSMECSATYGSCINQVEWRRNNDTVSSFQNHSVYQVFSSGSTVLRYENATLVDEGEYSCVTWVRENKVNQVKAVSNIKANATPTMNKIDSSPCNTCLVVFWNPHPRALGFPHRIKVNDPTSGKQLSNILETPVKIVKQVTKICGLLPLTSYNIQLLACTEKNLCLDEHTVNETATTVGIIIRNATVYQMNDNGNCIVSWEWPYNISTIFKISINSSLDGTPYVNTSELKIFVNKTESNFSYSFEPYPKQVYEVQVQLDENSKLCTEPVKAFGSCMGEIMQTTVQTTEEDTQEDEQINFTTIIIPIVVVLVLLLLGVALAVYRIRMRSTESDDKGRTSAANQMHDSHDYETVGDAEINAAYSTIGDQPSSHGAVYVNYEQNENVSYQNIKPNQDQLYEIPINRKEPVW